MGGSGVFFRMRTGSDLIFFGSELESDCKISQIAHLWRSSDYRVSQPGGIFNDAKVTIPCFFLQR